MDGLIWLVQVVHYPAYGFIDPLKFAAYQRFHTRTITFIVAPVMTLELLSGAYLFCNGQIAFGSGWNLAGLAITWLVTLALSVPAHEKLGAGPDDRHIRSLIRGNWIRTLMWTARSANIFLYLVGHAA